MLPRDAVDMTGQLRKLLSQRRGKRIRVGDPDLPSSALWNSACSGYLRSAATGGQWTQTRRARAFTEVEDMRCQLCLLTDGTELHRYECPTTLPAYGWPSAPKDVAIFCPSGPNRGASYWPGED